MPIRKLIQKVADAHRNHKLRHTPSGFGFAVADRIAYLDPAKWDHLAAAGSVFASREYLSALEAAPPDNVRPRYAMIFHGERPVAAVAAQAIEVEWSRLARPEGTLLKKAAAKAMGPLKTRVLVCGNLLSWGTHGVVVADGEDRTAVWPAVAEALYRIRRADKLSGESDLVLVKDLAGDDGAPLAPFSYRSMETEPDMVLEIPAAWKKHSDYLAGLTSSYRQAVKKIFKEVEAGGAVVERLSDPSPAAERLHQLYLQVHESAEVRPVTISPAFLPGLSRALGDRFRCTVIRKGSEIVGFVTSIRDGDTAVGYLIGFDRAAAGDLPLYLRLLHATLEDALEWGCRRLSLGRTALEPKARLGARPVPLRMWVRHRHPWLNLLVKGLAGAIPHADAPDRSPFKQPT